MTLTLDTLRVVSGDPEPVSERQPLTVNVVCNTDNSILQEQVKSALKRGLPPIDPIEPHDRIAVICGGGPSLNVREVAMWQIARGADVFALNGACKALNEVGCLPTYQVLLDPRAQNVMLKGLSRSYLLASQCAPEMFDAIPENCDIGLFHCAGSAAGLVNGTLIGGSVTVGLSAINLAFTLGYREIHLYGYDSSCAQGKHHAYPQEQNDQEARRINVQVQDENGEWREFQTSIAMAKQAELFPKTAEMVINAGAILAVHGEGMVPTIWRRLVAEHNRKQAAMPILDAAE